MIPRALPAVRHTRSRPLLLVLWAGLFLLSLGAISPLQAQDATANQAVIKIVRMQHREPSVVRAAIAPYLDERGAISQIDRNLVISTSRANLRELETLIEQVDVAARKLLLRVDFNYADAPVPTQNELGQVTPPKLSDYPVQSLLITEGDYAYFNRYQDNPSVGTQFDAYSQQLREDTQRSIPSLIVQAQLRADQVELEIAVSTLQTTDAAAATQDSALRRSITLPLNQWTPLSSAEESGSTATTQGVLAIRVEIMP